MDSLADVAVNSNRQICRIVSEMVLAVKLILTVMMLCILPNGAAINEAQFGIFRVFADDPLMCAVDEPNSVLTSKSQLSCSNQCLRDGDCTAFNYKKSAEQCELFESLPCNYSEVVDCVHYRVRPTFF